MRLARSGLSWTRDTVTVSVMLSTRERGIVHHLRGRFMTVVSELKIIRLDDATRTGSWVVKY